MSSRALYLICNSHIDPVWLWEWEEGVAETLSTFRQAAACCEEFENFVFNHNEALLYSWVESYEPELFSKIQKLVKRRKWHPMGGWFLQPDCNIPSGESFVRQILAGKLFFKKKFGVQPKTAINFDSFGHSRGLVQILRKSGYDSYLFCRPGARELSLPEDFIWVGYDGSGVLAHRAGEHYNSERGKARERVEKWLQENRQRKTGLLLWGIGDHGGGPSRLDLTRLQELIAENPDCLIRHGKPEDYFRALRKKQDTLPRYAKDLNPWAVGCYTTMAQVKQKHRLLESFYFLTEKMATSAACQGLLSYPHRELRLALEDLLFCEFHDILPGSSVFKVEAHALQRMDHGLELLARLRARAFFALLSGQQRAEEGEFPVFVYNPHPYPVSETVICEFQPQEPNPSRNTFWLPELKDENGALIPFQLEKESANISVDQRKRVVFQAELKPCQMNRFSCRLKEVKAKPAMNIKPANLLKLKSEYSEVVIDSESGLVEAYRVNGLDFLKPGSFRALVVEDYADPWGMLVRSFRKVKGSFTLMSKEESARFAAVDKYELEPVRIIEDGPVRTVVEALFKYNNSTLCQRYKVPKKGAEFELELRVFWNEKDRMLKLSVPTLFQRSSCRGQVAYGVEDFEREGEELVAQKWVGVISEDEQQALTVINSGTHGFDFAGGELRLSLLRSAAYAAHPVGPGIPLVRQDRFEPRIDQGERTFRFWVNGGDASSRLSHVEREAQVKNEPPFSLVCSPPGKGKKPLPGIIINDSVVEMAAFKTAEKKRWLIIRLFEPTGQARETQVAVPFLGLSFDVALKAFEVKSLAVDIASSNVFEVDLMERRLKKA